MYAVNWQCFGSGLGFETKREMAMQATSQNAMRVEQAIYNVVLLFGAPGTGKGTWGAILGKLPGFYHFSTGDMFRTLDTESEIGLKVMEYMRRGELVPDEIAFDLWTQHMQRAVLFGNFKPVKDILVLDGFPRTAKQVTMLSAVANIKVIVRLDCKDRGLLIDRLHKRAILEHREDDASEQTIRYRLDMYDQNTASILKAFSAELIDTVDVSEPPIKILSALATCLERRLLS